MGLFLILSLILFFLTGSVYGTTFTFTNKCSDTVWPGILSNAGTAQVESTGFELPSGSSRSFQFPTGWSGRFWARTGCTFDSSGHGSCATGDCGSGMVQCNGAGAAPPATLAEFSLSGPTSGKDFYDVSLVDGYNIAMTVESSGAGCPTTGCVNDLNSACPPELRVGEGAGLACRSACEAFGKDEYCCSGEYASPATCRPSVYSQLFKNACPRSYSYAYDDPTSTFTCSGGADYTITLCPDSSPSKKAATSTPAAATSTATPAATSTSTPTPKTAGEGEVLESDSWLASLAMGSSCSSMVFLHQLVPMGLSVVTTAFLLLLL